MSPDKKKQSAPQAIAPLEKPVDLSSMSQLASFSNQLKKFIVDRQLYSKIEGKNYVNIEGWQFAGAAIGMSPVIVKVDREQAPAGEIRYRAEAELLLKGERIGYGVAICSNLEGKRRKAPEYVIASMAQTRAIGKAFRNQLGWLMKMAGYEASPSEEMDGVRPDAPAAEPPAPKMANPQQIVGIKLLMNAAGRPTSEETDDWLKGLTEDKAEDVAIKLQAEIDAKKQQEEADGTASEDGAGSEDGEAAPPATE